jgi:hypothetical protein
MREIVTGVRVMSNTNLTVEVDGTDIVVRMPGTTNVAIYHKPNGIPKLRPKVQVGPVDFRVHAWTLANDVAHQLGWLKMEQGVG